MLTSTFNFQGSTFQEHLSQVDFYGYTALHAACEAGHADLIIPLLGDYNHNEDIYHGGVCVMKSLTPSWGLWLFWNNFFWLLSSAIARYRYQNQNAMWTKDTHCNQALHKLWYWHARVMMMMMITNWTNELKKISMTIGISPTMMAEAGADINRATYDATFTSLHHALAKV